MVIRTSTIAVACALFIWLAFGAGCNQTLDLDDTDFACDEQADCDVSRGFVCDTSIGKCVKEGDVDLDATDSGDDAADTSDATDDGGDSQDDAGDADNDVDADASTCECPDFCNANGECVQCLDNEDCDGTEACVEGLCQVQNCATREECPEGFACDIDEGVCIRTGNACRSNDECDQSSGQVCNLKGSCRQWDAQCQNRNDCVPGGRCENQRCRPACSNTGDCKALCANGPCFCNVAEGFCAQGETGSCRDSAACEPAELVCLEPSQLCGACDSLDDCGMNEFCRESGQCAGSTSTGCLNQSSCDKNEICIRNSGACVPYRCDYSEIGGDCPDFAYCAKTEFGGVELNLCQATTCDPDNDSCGSGVHCVAKTSEHGVCEPTGTAARGAECDLGLSSSNRHCTAGHACLPNPGSNPDRCELLCDPWGQTSTCPTTEVCTPALGVLGVCRRFTQPPDCSTEPMLAPCDQASVCVPDGAGNRACRTVCRLDQPSDCASGEVCNPAAVPGDVGWGQCTPACIDNSDCPGPNRRCIEVGETGQKYCAKRCGSQEDCPGTELVCKDGFCD